MKANGVTQNYIGIAESKVADLLCLSGLSQEQISLYLSYNPRHVKRLISNLKSSLNAANLAQLGFLWRDYKENMKGHKNDINKE